MSAWAQISVDVRPWYRRDLTVGALSLRLDVWPSNDECTLWFYGLHGGKSEGMEFKSPERAMRAAESMLQSYLRAAARELQSTSIAGTDAAEKASAAE